VPTLHPAGETLGGPIRCGRENGSGAHLRALPPGRVRQTRSGVTTTARRRPVPLPPFRAPGSGQTSAMGDRESRRATELWMFPLGAVLAGAGYTVGLVPLAVVGLLIIAVVATRIFAGPA